MGLFNLGKYVDVDKMSDMSIKNPRALFGDVLKQVSGTGYIRDIKYNIFHQIIAFKGIVDGVGCSTLVSNTAVALAELGLTVCVIDTSMLNPVQDILLKTSIKGNTPDWFDMMFEDISPLNVSGIAGKVSVLSFSGKSRDIIDAVSSRDSEELVTTALTEFHNKFDLILIDCCHELTAVSAAVLQQAHTVIQVWNDTPTVVHNIDNFVNNCAILSCSFGKMRNVVYSKMVDDVIGGLDDVLAAYKCTKIAENRLSKDVARVAILGKPLYQFTSVNGDIINYTECIIDIVCFICGIDDKFTSRGTITSDDIANGRVDGTFTKETIDYNKERDEKLDIQRTIPEEFLTVGELQNLKNEEGISTDIENTENSESSSMGSKVKKKGLFGRRK